jgi:hypothetical protein
MKMLKNGKKENINWWRVGGNGERLGVVSTEYKIVERNCKFG